MQKSPPLLFEGLRRLPTFVFSICFVVGLFSNRNLDASTEIQKLLGSSLEENSRFGGSIAKFGDTVIAGASRDNEFKGSAYVFIKEGEVWVEQAKLTASDGEEHDRFGASVLVDGDWAFVGAPEKNTVNYADEGCVYLFQRTGGQWSEVGKLFGSIGGHSSNFGVRMALEGDTLLVGAAGYTGERFNSGAVYVFERSGEIWNETQFLTASKEIVNSRFGSGISLSGDHALIASGDGAYILKKEDGEWIEEIKLFPSDYEQDDNFGQSGAVLGNLAVVGASGVDGTATTSGAAYVFEKDGGEWVEKAKLAPNGNSHGFYFGGNIAVADGLIAVGSTRGFIDDFDTGSVYLFEQKAGFWVEVERIIPADGQDEDSFGASVLIADNLLLVGAVENDEAEQDVGAAYVFEIETADAAPEAPEITFFSSEGPVLELSETAFHIRASDTSFPLHYVWQLSVDGGATWDTVEGETGTSLSIPVVASYMNDYLYRVIVSGYGGSTISQPRGLTVNLPIPKLTNFNLNGQDLGTDDREVSLSSSFFGVVPTEYRVSESPIFDGASWQPFEFPQTFDLSDGYGPKTVYYQGRNQNGSSEIGSSTISLNAPLIEIGRYVSSYSFFSLRDNFGYSMALSDSWMIVGAPASEDNRGSVYIFKLIAGIWAYDATISALNGEEGDRFGESVALKDGVLVIGAPERQGGRGSVYVFSQENGSWEPTIELIGSELGSGDHFGVSIDISGDSIIVGADEFTHFNSDEGRAYVFVRDGESWSEQAMIAASESQSDAHFGGEVAIDGDQAIVYASGNLENKGNAYLFSRQDGTWTEQIEFVAPPGVGALNDGWVGFVSGEPTFVGPDEGSVFIFEYNESQWIKQSILVSHIDELYNFNSLKVNDTGDRILMGGTERAAFLFFKEDNEWVQRNKIFSSSSNFGARVALMGDYFAVTQHPGSNSGMVHLYALKEEGVSVQPPFLLMSPIDSTVEENNTANFLVVVNGGPEFEYQWEISTDDGSTWTPIEGATGSGLNVDHTRSVDSGNQYRVAVTNASGSSVSSGATLTVIPKEGAPELSDFYINGDTEITYSSEVDLQMDWWGPEPTEYRVSEDFGFEGADWLPFTEMPSFTLSPEFGSKWIYLQVRNGDGESDIRSNSILYTENVNAPEVSQHRLLPDNFYRVSRFGTSVSISDDWAVVGDLHGGSQNGTTGNATLFFRESGTWERVSTIGPIEGESGDGFGESVAIDGDTLVVGSPRDIESDISTGSAYVFVRQGNQWIQEAKLQPENLGERFEFGERVAISGDTIVVGASGISIHTGTAYVYVRNGESWDLQAQLFASDGAANDRFGSSVSIEGDTVAVGASSDLVDGMSTGSAYVFTRSGGSWSEQAKLTAQDGMRVDRFGESISISQDTVVVGASGTDDNGGASGSAYIFERNGETWNQSAKLSPSDGHALGRFGTSVAIEANNVLVGALGPNRDQGSAYLFSRSGDSWIERVKFLGDGFGQRDEFGRSVGLSGNSAIVGATRDPSDSAYLFDLPADGVFTQKPGISLQPENVNVYAPEAATFSVTAFGTQPLGFQWQQSIDADNWEDVPGATDRVFTIDPTNTDINNYFYQVVVSNAYGTVTSDRVSLGVNELIPPGLNSIGFANSATETTTRVVEVGPSSSSGVISQFRVSEQFDFSGAAWRDAPIDSTFRLSSGFGEKTVYYQLRNDAGESEIQSASIHYRPADPLAFEPIAKFVPLETYPLQFFGQTLSISGETAVVGVSGDSETDTLAGTVYVFERDGEGWGEPVKLLAEDGSAADFFGSRVVIEGDTLVVLATGDDDSGDGVGSGYVFVRDGEGWRMQDKLLVDAPSVQLSFGDSVAISGNRIVVGVPGENTNGFRSGSAYVFIREGDVWSQEAKILPNDGKAYDNFGGEVDIQGDTMLVSSNGGGTETIQSGVVYVFENKSGSWIQTQKLLPDDGRTGDGFGSGLAIDEETIAIGAPGKDLDFDEASLDYTTRDAGLVYLFQRQASGWVLGEKLAAENRDSREVFGNSVALDRGTLVVGAQGKRIDNSERGSAFVYQMGAGGRWELLTELKRMDYATGDQFGIRVSISNGQILIGADGDALRRGSAYIYDISEVNTSDLLELAPVPAQTINELETLTFTVETVEPDGEGDALVFEFVGPSFGATLNPSSGEFSWTPEEGQGPSEYQYVVQASRGAAAVNISFSVSVLAVFDSIEDWVVDVFNNAVPQAAKALEADLDSDGLTTLLEYILGLDPEQHDSDAMLLLGQHEETEKLMLTTWLRDDSAVSVAVQVSEDLSNWDEVGLSFDSGTDTWSTGSGELSITATTEVAPGLWEITLTDEQGYSRLFVQIKAAD